ncbi:hypothetical protein O181_121454 [Austropuccinia psidii MF-1]|uniref:Uncharacterized protein n=1 Tax=Austropuccinia psidii MF-1 TaxID=1389203 RepID=A0A9Q3KL56_9BASI|nr:hypothetical protein [Austropuccinia psidii MF-1]
MQTYHATEIASLCSEIPLPHSIPTSHHSSSTLTAYKKFVGDPQKFASCCITLLDDSSNFKTWPNNINNHLSFIYKRETHIEDQILFLTSLSSRDHQLIVHFLSATLPRDFILTLGVPTSPLDALELFKAIQSCFPPNNFFQKLSLIFYWSDCIISASLDGCASINANITQWHQIFA